MTDDPRIAAVPDIHGHAKGEHKLYVDERPIPYTARMLFLWFFHACRRGAPRFLMVADHINYLTFEDPAAVNLVRRALKLAQAGDLYGAAETAGVEVAHAGVVGDGLRRGMRYSIGAEVDNDPRSRPDAQNIVDAMRPDGIVRSVHFLPITHPQFGESWMWPFDNPEFRDLYDVVGTDQTWELYMATLLDAIEKLPGHIVGHFYVPGKFGHWPADDVLESYEDRLLDACAERGMAVEINARTFYKYAVGEEAQLEKYRAVNLRLLRKAKEKGVAVAVGSDAHSPKDQGRGFTEILALLDEADINEIAFPIDGRMARVALRATDELRRASARSGGAKDQTEIAIPGTEEPEPVPEAVPEPVSVAKANEPAASPASTSAPKKRPSRAKKPAVVAAEPDAAEPEAAEPIATAPEVVAPSEPDVAAQVSPPAQEVPAEPDIATEETAAEGATAPEEAPQEITNVAPAVADLPEDLPEAVAVAEAEPVPGARPVAASAPDAPEEAAEIAPAERESSDAPATDASDESPAPVTALGAVAAVASAAVAAVVSAIKKRAPATPARQPAESTRAETPKRARPAKPIPPSKPSLKAKPKPTAAAKPVVAAKPASTPKRVAKAIVKPALRGSATAKASPSAAKASPSGAKSSSAAAKTTPVAAKKRVVVKAAAKKAAPARATTAKKAASKKTAPVRKPVSKGVSKTASRPSVKKTSAKKTAKKKTAKQRR